MTAQTKGTRSTTTQAASVKIAAAKGRPMLSWVGKRPLREVRAFPAQLIERFSAGGSVNREVDWSEWPDRYDRGGLLFHGDNKEVLAHLLANGFRGKVDLVYIDPPFDSGADYVRRVQLRGASGTARLDGESYTLGEQIQYTDIWANDTYLQFMYERLLLLKELLAVSGSIFLHVDYRRVHMLRLVMDEVFGPESYLAEAIWAYGESARGGKANSAQFPRNHDTVIWYRKGQSHTYHGARLERRTPVAKARDAGLREDERGWFKTAPRGNYTDESVSELEAEGRIHRTRTGGIRIKYYARADGDSIVEDILLGDVWTDISDAMHLSDDEDQAFPTQKPAALLDRIIRASSNPGDIVLDCFIGSGTTAAVAQKLGRRWIGADINKGAIQTTIKRLAGIMEEQASASVSAQQKLLTDVDDAPPFPAQLSFTTWRVNDYDLAIQHNEAVNLACEHLGVERTKADPFFDGTLGTELVKIVAFNHPVGPPDLEAVVAELDARPGEERNVVLVALGMEIACATWLDDYNRGRPVNRMRIVELRSDPKYGRFFEHRPASARVRLDGSTLVIDDFISPSILERLSQTDGVLSPQVTDWRSMVDSVMIDTAYDGGVFNVVVADIPERKSDLVAGRYELELSPGSSAPLAVKITDMLGEEVLVVIDR